MYTMAGNPVACAAALAHLDEIERLDLAGQAGRIGGYLLGRLRELRQRHPLIGDVRGLGMMLGLETVRDRSTREPADREMAKIVYRAFELGLVVFYGGIYSNVMEITPPLIMTGLMLHSVPMLRILVDCPCLFALPLLVLVLRLGAHPDAHVQLLLVDMDSPPLPVNSTGASSASTRTSKPAGSPETSSVPRMRSSLRCTSDIIAVSATVSVCAGR